MGGSIAAGGAAAGVLGSGAEVRAAAETTWTATGPADAPAIVFVHGTRVSRAIWQGQVERLTPEFRCVTLDLPGHGVLAADRFTLVAAADHVAAVIRAAVPDGRAIVVGASLGGYVAVETAVRHPDRVRGLVLAGCSADPIGPARFAMRLYALVLERVPRRILDGVNARLFRVLYGDAVGRAVVRGGFGEAGGAQAIRSLLRRRRFRDRLFGLWTPVLVLNGALDAVFLPGGDSWAAACRRGRHLVIPRAGHLSDLDQPDAFADAVRAFAREVATGG